MDVFDILNTEAARITERINDTATNYSEWAFDRVFESTKNSLESIKQHLYKESLLINNLKDEAGMQDLLTEFNQQKNTIVSEIETLVMIHVDEPGFEQGLERIAKQFGEHQIFCEETFYPQMETKMSGEDLRHFNEQLEQAILR